MTDEELQLKVEEFMQRHGLTPTTFGLWAMNDSRFVFDLRSGRNCFGKTIRRVCRFMAEYELKQEAKRLRLAEQSQVHHAAPQHSDGATEQDFTVKNFLSSA